ncbi:uncharacterized protein J4E92_000946 [Alternaria infectoria]|uniref:uncharacterized protein n=1 Tax=Alternaria infectoria TaxID=45303 RepID=UPI0022211007|nr:uncharacterized protein J4E92_000946 [Alternaria infectoria]KAI4939660.1 hypothetical protein J4E92_000946 [Alternaria infectoria]
MPSLLSLGVTVALSATGLFAHPLSNAQLVSRAEDLLPEYDYVIVGAGASGLTVANRLSEDKDVTVLVIEAGDLDQNEDYVTIPGLAGGAVGTKYDWNTSYAPDQALDGRVVSIPQGKVVGGSTKLNRMVFDRGSQSDYDGWETLGNEGWNFETFLKYFKKNEKSTPPTAEIQAEYDIQVNPEYHGDEGYMEVTYSPFFWPTTKNLVQATKELGISINDQATGNAFGGYFCPHNMVPMNWTRSSAEEAYYASAEPRPNYHLLTGRLVMRVLTESCNETNTVKATGVEFSTSADAESQQTKAKREVILAAGSLHTPQLLQVSGIGGASLLESINVTTVVDLPAVGYNLHDHLSVAVVNVLNTSVLTNTLASNTTFAAQAREQYDNEKSGPLTSPTGDFLLFLPLQTYSNATQSILAQAVAGGSSASLPADTPAEVARGYEAQFASLNKKLQANDSAMMEIIWADGVVVLGLQHPYSRGSVKANSSSMFDRPVADVGFLRNEVDTALLREGVHWARKFVATPSIASLNPFEAVPGNNVTASADIDAFIRSTASTLYHPAGSCKMGAREDGGVVDQELKVYGVNGLRVVDASVMPILPASHIMTTVYATAEKAADIIKEAAKGKY